MSSSFSAKCGSLLTLKVRTRWGFNPWRFQMRRTLAGLIPSSAASVRVLQCVAEVGRSRVVLRMTSASTALRCTVAGRPRPGASFSIPAVRCSANRRRQSPTVFSRMPRSAAMAVFSQPSAARSTILARRTRRVGVRRPLDHCRSTVRSASDSMMDAATRGISGIETCPSLNVIYFSRTTLGTNAIVNNPHAGCSLEIASCSDLREPSVGAVSSIQLPVRIRPMANRQ